MIDIIQDILHEATALIYILVFIVLGSVGFTIFNYVKENFTNPNATGEKKVLVFLFGGGSFLFVLYFFYLLLVFFDKNRIL